MQDTLKLKVRVFILILVSITLTLIFVSYSLSIRDNHFYPSNLYISDFALANVQKDEAEKALENLYADQKLRLVMPSNTVSLDLKDSGVYLNTSATLEKIEDTKHYLLLNLMGRGVDKVIAPVFDWDETVLNKVLTEIINENNTPAINAQVIYQNNENIQYITHKSGYSLNPEATIEKVKKSLAAGHLSIEPEVHELKPQITLTDLQKVRDMLAVATWHNVKLNEGERLLVAELDNTIIMPGESFNLENAWLKDNIDSSKIATLKAVLKNLFIKINSPADITYDLSLNTIHNNLPSPILINLDLDNDVLWLSIIGNQSDTNREITILEEKMVISPPTLKRMDKELAAGEQRVVEGKDTIIVKKYQIIKQGEVIQEKALLDEKKYPGYDTIIYEGYGTIDK